MSAPYQDASYAKESRVATVRLNRPDTMNALTPRLAAELLAVLDDALHDDGVRVLIVTGSGEAFCASEGRLAGADGDLSDQSARARVREAVLGNSRDVLQVLQEFDKPVIAGVNGDA